MGGEEDGGEFFLEVFSGEISISVIPVEEKMQAMLGVGVPVTHAYGLSESNSVSLTIDS